MLATDTPFEKSYRLGLEYLKDAETALNGILKFRQEERSDVTALVTLQRECDENLRLAEGKIGECAKVSPDGVAVLTVRGANIKGTVGMLRSMLEHSRGTRALYDAAFDRAIGHFQKALKESDLYKSENYYDLGVAHTEKHDRTNAIEAYENFLKFAEADDSKRLQAEKELDKLKSGMIGGKEFSGSWKVLAVLVGLILLAVIGGIGQGNYASAFSALVVFGGAAALYWKWKYK